MAALSRIYARLPSQLISPLYSLCPRSGQPLAVSKRLLSSTPDQDQFLGVWDEEKKHSFEELAKAAGIPESKINEVAQCKIRLGYQKHGDYWFLVEHIEGQTTGAISIFTFGKPYTKSSPLLKMDLNCLANRDGNRIIEHCEMPNKPGMPFITVREVHGDKLLSTTTLGKVTMTLHLKKKQ